MLKSIMNRCTDAVGLRAIQLYDMLPSPSQPQLVVKASCQPNADKGFYLLKQTLFGAHSHTKQ